MIVNVLDKGVKTQKRFLKDNPEIADAIENSVRVNAGILDEVMLKEGAIRASDEIVDE